MKRKAKIYDANGNFLRYAEGNDVLKDGEVLRSDFTMLDGLDAMQRLVVQDSVTPAVPRHAPGYVTDSDNAGRAERFFANKQRLSDAWQDALSAGPEQIKPQAAPQPQVTQDADAAYARRNARLEQAYITAGA
ncbi:hypothetical protein [Afipia clevelandensis]|uniref:Uncharacterized protein n=1 Tax=Afipia clevelandensis ATCC 49720 TaxID=883079 RepID=K8PPY2_9BRAD|nr:hypothetical protein [Afipia clevelandensis]EKS40408.1 hypothetical protein HMPREF9696_00859 [Afipia clevelandensis ATCC 49720]